MIRTGRSAVILAALALAAPAARAQVSPPGSEDTRFTFHRAEDGYLRLDGRTGQVSACARRPTGWACQVVADERDRIEAEIARLQAENAALKKELLSRNLALPDGITLGSPPVKVEEPRRAPREPELKRMMTLIENVWRRVVEMVAEAQRDFLRKT